MPDDSRESTTPETGAGKALMSDAASSPLPDIVVYYQELQKQCSEILQSSLGPTRAGQMATSRQLALELATWARTISNRRESQLLITASKEYEFALLALGQGHYRQAFKALRLVLELCLQAVSLSANELSLREWLDNRRDTVWAAIIDEQIGVFSHQFTQAFYPELMPHINHYRGMAASVYRECSECVHGNIPNHIPLPESLVYDEVVFNLWHSKSATVARIVHFGLCLRYFNDLGNLAIAELEPQLIDRLGHLTEIRGRLGGPTTS